MKKIEILQKRSEILKAVNGYFESQGFVAVETPLRTTQVIPEANIELFQSEGSLLQSSPEQYMKQLLAMGMPKIYQVGKAFRKGEIGEFHLPEFTILEWYRLGGDYQDLMDDCQALVTYIVAQVELPEEIKSYFSGSWEKLTVTAAFEQHGKCSLGEAVKKEEFDFCLVDQIELNLGKAAPCFLTDYPISEASLAKAKETDPNFAERFELYFKGIELANGFSELVDSAEQRKRFIIEREKSPWLQEYPLPELLLSALDQIPKACGIALGFDRLVMFLLGLDHIQRAVAFGPNDL